MQDGDDIGRVIAQGEGRFELHIRDFSELPRREDAFFDSPFFDAEGGGWFLRIFPNGWLGQTQIRIWLFSRSFLSGPSVSCTVGVKRADHQEETMGTKNCGGIYTPCTFSRTRLELEEEAGVWLPGGRLTLTLHFGPPKGDATSIPRDIRAEQSAIDPRRDVSQPPEAKATREVSSRESQTEVTIGKDERLEDYTSAATQGVMILSEHMKELLVKGDECDVIIRVKDKDFPAHRNILKSRSPVFRMMLTHPCEENDSGVISIEDCDTDAFGEFLSYMYCGKTGDLTPERALHLYSIADKYMSPDLKKECVLFLETSLSTSNICDVILLSARHGEKDLLELATHFFARNIDEILVKVEWQNFMAEHPTEANELYIKSLLHIKASYKTS